MRILSKALVLITDFVDKSVPESGLIANQESCELLLRTLLLIKERSEQGSERNSNLNSERREISSMTVFMSVRVSGLCAMASTHHFVRDVRALVRHS